MLSVLFHSMTQNVVKIKLFFFTKQFVEHKKSMNAPTSENQDCLLQNW